jgi:3-oxoacyl-[acyl-carrier protein] reductase
MDLELKGRKVAIAGSSKGTGFAIAKLFHNEGAKVWLSGRTDSPLSSASLELDNAPFTSCDLSTPTGQRTFARDVHSQWKALDILVLNVGSGRSDFKGLDTPDAEWLRVFQLNFFSHAALIREFKPLLKDGEHPSIVSVSSIVGETRLAAPLAYTAAKSALNQFCNAACLELAQSGIRFNTVVPGNILTSGGRWEELLAQDPEKVKNFIDTQVPLKRFARPEEVAASVVFLSSPRAAFCTGSSLRVDGGQVPAF